MPHRASQGLSGLILKWSKRVSEDNYQYQDVIRIGQEAAHLMQHPVFNMAYQAVLEDLQARFFNTEPGHTRTLEEIRREGNALAKVVSQLQRAVTQASQVVNAQAAAAERGDA